MLSLGDEARLNVPGTPEGNWRWRVDAALLTDEVAARYRTLAKRDRTVRGTAFADDWRAFMLNREINTSADLYTMLDTFTGGVSWEEFYDKRDMPAPFLIYNQVPDRFLVQFFEEARRAKCG